MTEFEKIATDCRAAADYYDDHPGHSGPETVSDIYRTIQRLCECLEADRRAFNALNGPR